MILHLLLFMVFVGAYFACWLCLHGANNESDRQSHSYTRTYITLGIISIKNQLSMSAYYVIIVHTERRVRSTKMLPSWRDNLYAILHFSRYMILWRTSNLIQDFFFGRVFALYIPSDIYMCTKNVYGSFSIRCSPINQHAEILSIFRTNHRGGNIRKIIFLTIFIHSYIDALMHTFAKNGSLGYTEWYWATPEYFDTKNVFHLQRV